MKCFEILFQATKNRGSIMRRDYHGNTPLHYAVKYGKKSFKYINFNQFKIKVLLNSGKMETVLFILTNESTCKSINTQNKKGKTPLFSAKDPKYLYLLLSYGADPTLGRVGDLTLLEYLIQVKPDNARALLNYELDTNDQAHN